MVMTLHIPEAIHQLMIEHARAELPNECVGMLIGSSDGQVSEYLPLENELKCPTRFLTEPRSMLRAEKRCRELRLKVLAMFHSHPTSPAVPSKYDVADHYSGEVMCLIVSLEKEPPEVAGWWIHEGMFRRGVVQIDQATA